MEQMTIINQQSLPVSKCVNFGFADSSKKIKSRKKKIKSGKSKKRKIKKIWLNDAFTNPYLLK
jgi:hypothetical protein